jgi:methylmalonyl-CoA mutase C-terminal domain/subunit
VLLTGGGIIPAEDASALESQGWARLFGPGTSTEEIVRWIRSEVSQRRTAEGVK